MGSRVGKYPAALVLYFLCIGLWHPSYAQDVVEVKNITLSKGDVGETANVSCVVTPETARISWLFQGNPLQLNNSRLKVTTHERALHLRDLDRLDGPSIKSKMTTLTISNATASDAGNYTCLASKGDVTHSKMAVLDLSFPAKLISKTDTVKEKFADHANVTMQCVFEVYKPTEVKWFKKSADEDILIKTDETYKRINAKQIQSFFHVLIQDKTTDNGTYSCTIEDTVTSTNITGDIALLVFSEPQVKIDTVIPINTTQLYLNWTLNTFNSPVFGFRLILLQNQKDLSFVDRIDIDPKTTSFVLGDLVKDTAYMIILKVATAHGISKYSYDLVKTLAKEPIFVPNIYIKKLSATSVTIGWAPPPSDIAELIHHYILKARKKDDDKDMPRIAYYQRDSRNLPYEFDNLEPHSSYVFEVQACSEYSNTCWEWSKKMEAVTQDGVPGMLSNVCQSNRPKDSEQIFADYVAFELRKLSKEDKRTLREILQRAIVYIQE